MRFEITKEGATLPLIAAIHEHFRRRRRRLLAASVNLTARYADHALWMPNPDPPILTGMDAVKYDEEVHLVRRHRRPIFQTLRTVKLTQDTTVPMVREAARCGVTGYKGYPDHPHAKDVTTNSAGGVSDYFALEEVIAEIFKLDLVLLTHPETPLDFCLDRQRKFIETARFLVALAKKYKGRVTFEHASTADMIYFADSLDYDGVLITITLQHLIDTLDDLLGGKCKVHHFYKPLANRPEDREALREAFLRMMRYVAFGSDSAPHYKHEKECAEGCAGAFTAPMLIQKLVGLVIDLCGGDTERALKVLIHVLSDNPRRFYRLPPPSGVIELAREPWQIPNLVGGARPYLFGQQTQFTLVRRIDS